MDMKSKILLILVLISLLAAPAFAEEGIITRAGKWLDGTTEQCPDCPPCPAYSVQGGVVCPSTPAAEIARPPFELEAVVDFFTTPAGGSPQFGIENFTFRGKHNFSPVLNVYVSYSVATFEKTDYEGSLYDKTWQYQTAMLGVGWYVHPVIEIFWGAGKVQAKNAEGAEELGLAIEYGIKAHYPINQFGYKLIGGLLTREVPLADDNVDISRSQAEASATYIFVGVAFPIGVL